MRLLALTVAVYCYLQPGLALAEDTARQLAGSWKLNSWTIQIIGASGATIRPPAGSRANAGLDLRLVTHRRCRKLGGEHWRGPSEIAQEDGVIWRRLRVEHERYPLDAGGDLLEHLYPFSEHREIDE